MDVILEYVVPIVSCFVVYYLFDKSGFKAGLIFKFILQLVVYGLNGTLLEFYNTGMLSLIILLMISIIIILITTAIEYFAFNRTNSFFTYFILGAIIEFLISIAFSFVLVFIIGMII